MRDGANRARFFACMAANANLRVNQMLLYKLGHHLTSRHMKLHILKIARLVVDTDLGGCNPARKLARLPLRLHQRLDEVAIFGAGEIFTALFDPLLLIEDGPVGSDEGAGKGADVAVKTLVWQF